MNFNTVVSGYSLTKIKTFTGMEGQGLNAVICFNGKPTCFVLDEATGGDVRFDFRNPAQNGKSYEAHKDTAKVREEACLDAMHQWWKTADGAAESRKFADELNAAYPDSPKGDERRHALEAWVNWAMDTEATRKQVDRWAKTQTVFRLKGDKEGSFRTIKHVFSDPRVAVHMAKTYGETLEYVHGGDVATILAAKAA